MKPEITLSTNNVESLFLFQTKYFFNDIDLYIMLLNLKFEIFFKKKCLHI
jgi:hypothetical protein